MARKIAEIAKINLTLSPSENKRVMSPELFQWLDRELVRIEKLGYISCAAGYDATARIVPSYYLIPDQLLWIVPSAKPYAQWKNIAFVFTWDTWFVVISSIIGMAIFLWFFYREIILLTIFELAMSHFQMNIGKY